MSFIPALLLSAVIPFAAPLPVDFDFTLGPLGRFVHHGPMPMVVADLPVGFLFVLAISSLGVYGIALAGWSSNSKYALLGGLRASAQMISYEVAMGMSLIPVLLLSGNVELHDDHRAAAGRALVRRCRSSSRSSSSSSRASPRPTGCRSTCPRPSPS